MKPFSTVGTPASTYSSEFMEALCHLFVNKGYSYQQEPNDQTRLIFMMLDKDKPRPFRRQAQATFVVSLLEIDSLGSMNHKDVLKKGYPYLVRSLANHLILYCPVPNEEKCRIFFITPEQGCYGIEGLLKPDKQLLQTVYARLEPLASSRLVINNRFEPDLADELWAGDDVTEQLRISGKKLDEMDLLPAPFPLEELISERDMRHIRKLYGIGGLSYGNLSSRKDDQRFWMSASGVNKADMRVVGHDMLLIKDFDAEEEAMRISVPPNGTYRRASVDAIEHWMIYQEHPEVGAIVHVHAWMDGIEETEINYPCGTIELAEAVANHIRESERPAQTVIGLKNHGLTITGTDLIDIFNRIEGRIIPQVPMQ